jgi:hypothetical protein
VSVYIATYFRRSGEDSWPLDHGDDPSFGSSARFGGLLTWGVCRPNLRNRVEPGDLVIFFATDRLGRHRPGPARYQFVGFATVARCVRQTDIWQDPTLKLYRQYRNLLIRRDGGSFEHFEPEDGVWHNDWLRRICGRDSFTETDFWTYEQRHRLPSRINGRRIEVANNYFMFSAKPNETFVLAAPPIVARVRRNGQLETWLTSGFASRLRRLVLGSTTRALRTRNEQRAHPYIRLSVPVEPLRSQLRSLCKSHGLRARRGRAGSVPVPKRRSPLSIRRGC